MAEFGKSSRERLATCQPLLQTLMYRVVARRDIFIACGTRGKEEQELAFVQEKSKVRWPNSKHNKSPSEAADAVPWPEKWDSPSAFLEVRTIVMEEWAQMVDEGLTIGWDLRWGGDWDGDGDLTDQKFDDRPHWELVRKGTK